jgi:hypothetical protein
VYADSIIQAGGTGAVNLTGSGRGSGEGVDTNDSDSVQLIGGSGGLTIIGSKADASTDGPGLTLAGSLVSQGGEIIITGTGSSAGTNAYKSHRAPGQPSLWETAKRRRSQSTVLSPPAIRMGCS